MGRNTNTEGSTPKASSSRSGGRNGSFYAIGGVIVAGTLCLSVLGSRAAIGYMQNQSDAKLKQAQESLLEKDREQWQDKLDAEIEAREAAESELAEYQQKYGFTTEQLDWAHEKHVSWDEDGFPVDESGNVVDDPTTTTNEIERYEEFLKAQEEPVAVEEETEAETESTAEGETEVEPEEESHWWDGMDFIQVDEDGNPYYVVERGDTLSSIGARTGFPYKQLAEYNNLSNPSLLEIGQIIRFPKDGQFITNGEKGAGRG